MTTGLPPVRIAGIGTALPERIHDQSKIVEAVFSGLPGWDPSWAEVFAASGVTWRATVLDDLPAFYDRDRVPSTSERMRAFIPAARRLGAEAARLALARAGDGDPAAVAGRVRDLLAVSCTGYHGPGLDVHLIADLGLDRHVRRLAIGHMGCYAALPALRTAAALAAASGEGALAACVELCTLHLQPPTRREEVVQFALFADGAAAAMVLPAQQEGGAPAATGPEIIGGHTVTVPSSEDRMGWAVADDGFRMWLSPRVPALVERGIEELVDGLLAPYGIARAEVDHWVVHPGGPEILERVHRRLRLPAGALDSSWAALAEGGNRSSATVLFILDDLLTSGAVQPGEWVAMLAFGTGLTLDGILLRA